MALAHPPGGRHGLASRTNAGPSSALIWLVRLALALVFVLNVSCAFAFIARPWLYTPGFELSGVAGETLVRGLGILFLMWNATYPLALVHPWRYRWLFAIVLVQQAIGLLGEAWLLWALPAGHAALAASGRRFVAFDGAALALMLASFGALALAGRHSRRQGITPAGDHPPRTPPADGPAPPAPVDVGRA